MALVIMGRMRKDAVSASQSYGSSETSDGEHTRPPHQSTESQKRLTDIQLKKTREANKAASSKAAGSRDNMVLPLQAKAPSVPHPVGPPRAPLPAPPPGPPQHNPP